MHRRTVLLGLAAATGGLAGCLQAEDDDPDESNGGEPGAGGGDTPASGGGENGSGESDGADDPTVEDSSVETTAADCADGDQADVTVERGDGAVTVTGSLQASTPCHEAVLEDVAVEDGELALTVDVEETGADVCTECVAEIEYEATVELSDVDALDQVRVEHVDGGTTAVGWDSASESSSEEPDENETA